MSPAHGRRRRQLQVETAVEVRTDALDRAKRTGLQVLVVAIIVDLLPVLIDAATRSERGDDVEWDRLGWAALRIALSAALSFVLRFLSTPATLADD